MLCITVISIRSSIPYVGHPACYTRLCNNIDFKMAQFIGKWKVDTTTFQNVDAFCKVAGNYR